MSTVTERHPAAERAKQDAQMCLGRLLKTFSFVPDDKLTWAPEPTCKSALQIVAHCAVANGMFTTIISTGGFPDGPIEELFAAGAAAEAAITTRGAAIAAVEASVAEVVAAIESVPAEKVDADVVTPFMTAPMAFFMNIPGRHLDNHAAQIDFLQTCWGDMDWHM